MFDVTCFRKCKASTCWIAQPAVKQLQALSLHTGSLARSLRELAGRWKASFQMGHVFQMCFFHFHIFIFTMPPNRSNIKSNLSRGVLCQRAAQAGGWLGVVFPFFKSLRVSHCATAPLRCRGLPALGSLERSHQIDHEEVEPRGGHNAFSEQICELDWVGRCSDSMRLYVVICNDFHDFHLQHFFRNLQDVHSICQVADGDIEALGHVMRTLREVWTVWTWPVDIFFCFLDPPGRSERSKVKSN